MADTQDFTGLQTTESHDSGEKHLTFNLDKEVYGIEILKVKEIIGLMPITKVPRMPSCIRGVINLRGKVIPVTDLRVKFGLEQAENTNETCIIVVDTGYGGDETTMGLLVDSVSEVLDVAHHDIEESPRLGEGIDTDYIRGMGKTGEKVIMLLDIERVMAMEFNELLETPAL